MTEFKGSIDGEYIKSILDAITVLVEECRVVFEDDNVRIRGTDPADVALVLIEISEEAFDDPTITEGDVCWNFSEMADMVGTVGKENKVNLELGEHNLNLDILDLNFTLSLIDPDSLDRDRTKPDLDLPAEIVLDSSALKRGVKAADLVADHVEFGIDEDESAFYMEAKGDSNEVILTRKKRDLVTLTLESVGSTYSVDYLKKICDALPDDTEVQIRLGDDYPAELSFKLADENATVTYFLSPRIQPD